MIGLNYVGSLCKGIVLFVYVYIPYIVYKVFSHILFFDVAHHSPYHHITMTKGLSDVGITLCPSEGGRGDLLSSIVIQEQCENAKLLAFSTNEESLFHEAGIWIPSTKEWIITSNRLVRGNGDPHVIISAINGEGDVRQLNDLSDTIPMGNGGTADGKGGAFLCSQGTQDVGGAIYHTTSDYTTATAIVHQDISELPNKKKVILNSPNDVVVYQKKWLLFTDPTYGYEQGFRSKPQSGEFVWYASLDGSIVSPLTITGLCKPNGICLSPDQRTLYVTDSAYATGTGMVDPDRPRHVLAYDISSGEDQKQSPKLANCRILFKFCCRQGVPDGIKVDVDGNIYVGAGDGTRIFSSCGKPIGLIGLKGGVRIYVLEGTTCVICYC